MMIPKNFKTYYTKLLGTRSQEFFEYCMQPLRKSLRINTLKTNNQDFPEDWDTKPVEWCTNGYYVDRKEDRSPIGYKIEHFLGQWYIQEASSMLPVEALLKNATITDQTLILDMASSPGSKSTQIAAKMKDKGTLIVNEYSSSRLKGLYSNLERCGVSQSILTHADGGVFGEKYPQSFDYLLLDAPCSGEGTVRKDYSALQGWSIEKVKMMEGIQKKLIQSSWEALKPGGSMVYSTCTLNTYENENVIAFLQETYDDVVIENLSNLFPEAEKSATPEGYLKLFPQDFNTEGFFVAKINKKITSVSPITPNLPKVFPFTPVVKKERDIITQYFKNHFGYEIAHPERLWKRGKEIWYFPPRFAEIAEKMRCDRIGIFVCEVHTKEIRLHHQCAIAWGQDFTKHTHEVSLTDADKVRNGEDLSFDQFKDGDQILVRYQGLPLALGKYIKRKWKNRIPRTNIRR